MQAIVAHEQQLWICLTCVYHREIELEMKDIVVLILRLTAGRNLSFIDPVCL